MKLDYDICGFLDGEKFRLGVAGFYPSRIKRTFIVNMVTIMVYSITLSQMAVASAFVADTTEITEISEIFLFLMTQVGFINKLLNFHYNTESMALLEKIISDEIFIPVTPNELGIFKKYFTKCQRVINVFLMLCVGTVALYGIFPVLDNTQSDRKKYLFPGKFPFNPDDYYKLIYTAEFFSVAVSAWNNAAMDSLFTKHTVIATALFAILAEKIKTLQDDNEDHTLVKKRIRHCVVYYNKINGHITIIEKTFSYGILIQFLCSAVVICLTGFQIMLVVSFRSIKFGLMTMYFSCMMCQVTLYCWYGHILMEKSDGITRACYATNWNEMNVENQKMLMLIMERAKRPAALCAAGVFQLNLLTLMAILKNSYSFFAVLRQIYSK